jgi:hypothetical protein
VVDSRAAAGNEPADRRIRVVCLQQLNQRLAGRKTHYARPIGIIELYTLESEHIAKKGHALAQRADCDADMGDASPAWGCRGH